MSWQLDKAHSSVEFSVRHMMISKVRGRFEDFEVTVNFDESNPTNTSVDATVDIASINTREPQRDGHLKSPDFFNADAYPTMTFKSTKVEKVDNSHAKLIGDLTIQNVTKPVTLDVEYAGKAVNPFTGSETVGFTANGKISRKEWGMTWNQALETGGIMVGDEVTIHLEVELVKESEQVAEQATA
ncbi:MAG: polyisoprenoid-binding protein [Anaerolineae bacterium]|nr:polyisoprenoid-binding protein [Anaerolineae bacterium]